MELPGQISNSLIFQKLSRYTEVVISVHKHKKFKISKHRELHAGGYSLGQVLGQSRNGEVRLAYTPDWEPVAIKLIPRLSIDANSIDRLENGLRALNELEHPHVMQINSVFIDENYLGLIMDYASKGDVHKFIFEHGKVEEDTARRWFAQLVSVVDELHTKSYAHRDIKPENLLIDAEGNILLTDFELCVSFERQGFPYVNSVCGTPTFCCPEAILSASGYDICKADIWSMGVTLFVMVAGYRPFDDNEFPARTKAEVANLYMHIMSTPLHLPGFLSPGLVELLKGLLAKDPQRRLSLADIKKHCWFEEYDSVWRSPEIVGYSQRRSRRTSRYGSLSSISSSQTLNDQMAECTKQIRGPIIWDPDAGFSAPY